MPIRTKYEIYCTQKLAPVYWGYDKTMAFVEMEERIRNPKGDTYRILQTPETVGNLTKAEEYLLLVYEVRRLINKYYSNGCKFEDMKESLKYETNLDKWNKRTQAFIDAHLDYKPTDKKSFAFCQLVTEWRKVWHERHAYRKRKMGYEEQVYKEMKKKESQLGTEIDKYIKKELQLL